MRWKQEDRFADPVQFRWKSIVMIQKVIVLTVIVLSVMLRQTMLNRMERFLGNTSYKTKLKF